MLTAANKALSVALTLAILATGALAVHLSGVYVTVTYTMGKEPESVSMIQLADALPATVKQHTIKGKK